MAMVRTSLALSSTRQLLSLRSSSHIAAVQSLYLRSPAISAHVGPSNCAFQSKAQFRTSLVVAAPKFDGSLRLSGWLQCVRGISAPSGKEVSISFPVSLEENTTIDEAILDQLEMDGQLALKLVVDKMENLENLDTVELSLLLCNDSFIQDLNSKWLGKDSPTDVLSFPQDQPAGLTPYLLLGDIIISVETAARQAQDRGHNLLDELRILLVHGLLHVLGYDHELGEDASEEMEDRETQILSKLGWKSKGLINAAFQSTTEDVPESNGGLTSAGNLDESDRKFGAKPPFKLLFCDMDGTLLNGKSRVTESSANALRAAVKKGVQVVIATGKTQYGAMGCLQPVGLTGEDGVISSKSPGVFTQGLQVYGRGGSSIYSAHLHEDLVRQAFEYSMEHDLPTVGFSGNRCVTISRDPVIEDLHDVYMEPKVEIMSSIDELMSSCTVQKIVFMSSPDFVKSKLRPHWEMLTRGKATLVQAQADMLEILPPGQSKGSGVKMLLEHLGVSPEEMMAIGDGENDIEMLELAGWSVAMANGTDRTKAVADALTASNNDDGVALAIQKYILS